MNINKKTIVFLVASSMLGIILNLFVGFFLPLVVDYSNYSIYKTFTLYIGFIPLIHLGICDGVLINYRKKTLEELKKINFKKSIIMFSVVQIGLGLGLFLLLFNYIDQVFLMILLAIPFVNISTYLKQIVILIDKFKVVSFLSIINKVILLLSILLLFVTGNDTYLILVFASLITYLIQSIISIILIRKSLFDSSVNTLENISLKKAIIVGAPTLLSYIVATFLLGVDRIFVERFHTEYEYAIFSFSYSLITIILTVMDSLNVVIFSSMFKDEGDQKIKIFNNIGTFISFIFSICAIFAILIIPLINIVIPKYNDSIPIFLILLPIVFLKVNYTSRYWPYLNSVNKQNKILLSNLVVLIISILLNISVFIFNGSLIWYAIMTVITLVVLNIILGLIVNVDNNKLKALPSFSFLLLILVYIITYQFLNVYTYAFLVLFCSVRIYIDLRKNIIPLFLQWKNKV
ncbi:MAG: hypothetical protein R3Y05_00315 [bacterium]